MAGVSQPAIAKAIKKGKLTVSGKLVDTDGPETVEYMRVRDMVRAGTAPNKDRRGDEFPIDKESYGTTDDGPVALPPKGTIQRANLELTEARKMQVMIKNKKEIGELVERKFVEEAVFVPIDTMAVQWNTDVPKTIAAQLFASINGGATEKEAEDQIRTLLSSTIKAMKGKLKAAAKAMQ